MPNDLEAIIKAGFAQRAQEIERHRTAIGLVEHLDTELKSLRLDSCMRVLDREGGLEIVLRIPLPMADQAEPSWPAMTIGAGMSSVEASPVDDPPAAPPKSPARVNGRENVWTDDMLAEMARLREVGRTPAEIAKILGLNRKQVSNKLYQMKTQSAQKRVARPVAQEPFWTAEEDETLIRMALDGRTMREVAEAVGRGFEATKSRRYKKLRGEIERRQKHPVAAAMPTSAPTAPAVEAPDTPARYTAPVVEAPDTPARYTAPVVEAPDTPARYTAPVVEARDTPAPETRDLKLERVEAHLDQLGHAGIWDAGLDFEMVEMLTSGTKAAAAAQILEIPKDEIIRRFRALCPDPTIDNQERLIAALKARAQGN